MKVNSFCLQVWEDVIKKVLFFHSPLQSPLQIWGTIVNENVELWVCSPAKTNWLWNRMYLSLHVFYLSFLCLSASFFPFNMFFFLFLPVMQKSSRRIILYWIKIKQKNNDVKMQKDVKPLACSWQRIFAAPHSPLLVLLLILENSTQIWCFANFPASVFCDCISMILWYTEAQF